MKKILLPILILIQINLFGQNYIPFDFENGIWICDEGLFGGDIQTSDIQYYTDGDTVINGNIYLRLIEYRIDTDYEPGTEPVLFFGYTGAIRNSGNKQVEFIDHWNDEPEIIYDFNLSVGDTIKVGYGAEPYEPEPLVVLSIDSIELCGNYHKRYNLNDTIWHLMTPVSLTEGIGFNVGLINPYFFQFEQESTLNCYTERNNENCEECILLLSNKELENNFKIDIFPNPNSGLLKIRSDKYIIGYDIINELGLIIYSENNLNNMDLALNTDLSNGIYFIKFKTLDQKIYLKKMIIQK